MKSACLIILSAVAVKCLEHDFKGFDDNILFSINWPGANNILENAAEDANKPQHTDVMAVQTFDDEKYECHLPELKSKQTDSTAEYDGPSPLSLLNPLFTQKICSYRLESYWSYEVCHGRYIRQYHEERDGKQMKLQEFYLGLWSIDNQAKLAEELKSIQENKIPPKMIKVERIPLPSIEMVMDGGTVCDLNNKPRLTRVHYVCYSHGKHEVYSFKETATCEYEIIILSPLLCEHPQFKPEDVSINPINCFPKLGAGKKPQSLIKMEFDDLKLRFSSQRSLNDNDADAKDIVAVLKVEKIDKDGETQLKFELHPLNEEDADEVKSSPAKPLPVITDDSPVRAFLNGENCLNGGTGWWKYEFCYGKHVTQYHVDRTGYKTSLLLGKFNEEAHLEWIKENRGKAPKPVDVRTSVSHFYSGGDICDKTSKPRQTEVKLKCLENSSSPAQVSLYLLEPRTCHYILGVESPLICDILPLADENGLIKTIKPSKGETSAEDSFTKEKEATKDKKSVVEKFGFD